MQAQRAVLRVAPYESGRGYTRTNAGFSGAVDLLRWAVPGLWGAVQSVGLSDRTPGLVTARWSVRVGCAYNYGRKVGDDRSVAFSDVVVLRLRGRPISHVLHAYPDARLKTDKQSSSGREAARNRLLTRHQEVPREVPPHGVEQEERPDEEHDTRDQTDGHRTYTFPCALKPAHNPPVVDGQREDK